MSLASLLLMPPRGGHARARLAAILMAVLAVVLLLRAPRAEAQEADEAEASGEENSPPPLPGEEAAPPEATAEEAAPPDDEAEEAAPDSEPSGTEELSISEVVRAIRRTPASPFVPDPSRIAPSHARLRVGSLLAVEEEGTEVVLRIDTTRPLPRGTLVRIGETRAIVVSADEETARARLELNERLDPGEREVFTENRSGGYPLEPHLADGAATFLARLRLGLPVPALYEEAQHFLSLLELSGSYLFKEPVRVGLEVMPLGLGFAQVPNGVGGTTLAASVPLAAHAYASLALHHLELGLGVGYALTDAGTARALPSADTLRSQFSFQQRLRIGAPEGLSLWLRTSAVFDDYGSGFGSIRGGLRIPLSTEAWLLLEGGFGVSGFVYGELGARVLLEREGTMGSLFLHLSGGVLSLLQPVDLTGPSLGVGLEWRVR